MSGFQYAKAVGTIGEVSKFGRDICLLLGIDDYLLALKINTYVHPTWFKLIADFAKKAVALPLVEVEKLVEEHPEFRVWI